MKYAAAYSSALSLSSMRICFESALAGKQTMEEVAKTTLLVITLEDQFLSRLLEEPCQVIRAVIIRALSHIFAIAVYYPRLYGGRGKN